MFLPDGKEYVFLGGGSPDTCDDGIEGMEEYDVAEDKWRLAERHQSINPPGPSVMVKTNSSILQELQDGKKSRKCH